MWVVILGISGKPPLIYPNNKFHSEYSPKISAYFSYTGSSIKGKVEDCDEPYLQYFNKVLYS